LEKETDLVKDSGKDLVMGLERDSEMVMGTVKEMAKDLEKETDLVKVTGTDLA
jgi:hypothetical protein